MQSLGFICSSLYQSTYNIPRLMSFLLLLHSVIIASGDVVMYKPSMRWAIEWRGWVDGMLGNCWELLLVLYIEPHAIDWLMKVFMQLINTQYACQQFLVSSLDPVWSLVFSIYSFAIRRLRPLVSLVYKRGEAWHRYNQRTTRSLYRQVSSDKNETKTGPYYIYQQLVIIHFIGRY